VNERLRALATPAVGDVALGVLAAVSIVAATGQIEVSEGERALDPVAYACMVTAGGALAGRRRVPLLTVAVITAALAVYISRDYPGGPVFVTLFVALYSVATQRSRRVVLTSAALAAGSLVVVGEVAGTGPGLVHLVFVGWAGAAVFLGDALRSRRDHMAALEERARHLEQSREEEARRRVAEERLRIARDLHDSVAHSMATINVQAGVAAHVIDRHPDRARESLVVIQQASGEVLDELAAVLGLLRLDPSEAPDRSPTPGLDQLPALVSSTRRSGLEVALDAESGPDEVSPSIGVAAYRIVQESLTNVVRHAGPAARATVTIAADGIGGLCVEVADNGTGPDGSNAADSAAPGAGVGIIGMRERAEATGGRLEAGPGPAGGFVVRATWPGRS
jgi:signal transduction histidine kinase